MDLWIRSQDRKVLRKANHLKIEKQGDKYCITEMATIYGKYDSEERAIEILNKIQDFISFAEFDNVPAARYEEAQIDAIRYLSRNLSKVGKVFYMPEE